MNTSTNQTAARAGNNPALDAFNELVRACNIQDGQYQAAIALVRGHLAAAPEMLAALQSVSGLLRDWVNHQPVEMCAVAEQLAAVQSALSQALQSPTH